MRSFGVLCIVCGILLVLIAFGMNTSVSSYGVGEVNNLGLLQQQMMVLQTGPGGFVAGSVLFAGAAIHDSHRLPRPDSASVSTITESDEDREERLAGVRRLNRVIGLTLLAAIALLVLVVIIASRS